MKGKTGFVGLNKHVQRAERSGPCKASLRGCRWRPESRAPATVTTNPWSDQQQKQTSSTRHGQRGPEPSRSVQPYQRPRWPNMQSPRASNPDAGARIVTTAAKWRVLKAKLRPKDAMTKEHWPAFQICVVIGPPITIRNSTMSNIGIDPTIATRHAVVTRGPKAHQWSPRTAAITAERSPKPGGGASPPPSHVRPAIQASSNKAPGLSSPMTQPAASRPTVCKVFCTGSSIVIMVSARGVPGSGLRSVGTGPCSRGSS